MPGNGLQQKSSKHHQIQSKAAVRKASNAPDPVQAFVEDLAEVVKKEVTPSSNGHAHDSAGGKVEAPDTATKATAQVGSAVNEDVNEEIKVSCDQILRETADDSEMLEEFICKICQVHIVGAEPKLTRCSHLFCGDCIAQWFEVHPRSLSWAQRAKAKGLVPCPVCKEPLHQERDLFRVCATGQNESALLWRLLSGVKIVCGNNSKCRANGKCTWIGEYGSYQKHLQSCKNIPLDNVADATPGMSVEQTLEPRKDVQSAGPGRSSLAADSSLGMSSEHELESREDGQAVVSGIDVASQLQQPVAQQNSAVRALASSALRTIRSFTATGTSQLSVEKGELIHVLSQHPSGWTYGRKVHEATQAEQEEQPAGWFPNWAIA